MADDPRYCLDMADGVYRVLSGSGLLATIQPSLFINGAYTLIVDDTPQSHVNLDDPARLFFEYVQRMAHVIDVFRAPGEPIQALHLGAGGLTLPRYIGHTRPGSGQLVVELERDLVEFVRQHLPLPAETKLSMRYGDARDVLSHLPRTRLGTFDVLIVDVFAGSRTPRHVTTAEFYTEAARMLRPDGVLLVNVMDVAGLRFARNQAATLAASMPVTAALGNAYSIATSDSGNVVLLGAASPLPARWVERLLADGPHPAAVLMGAELRQFIADSPVRTDASVASAEPELPRER